MSKKEKEVKTQSGTKTRENSDASRSESTHVDSVKREQGLVKSGD